MSEATRAIALDAAVKLAAVGGVTDAEGVVSIASVFHAFVLADKTVAAAPPAPPVAPTVPKPTPLKPAKPAKPAQTEEQAVAAAAAAAEAAAEAADAEPTVTKEAVGKAIEALLKANMRTQCVALLKKFGAASASGVSEADRAAFVEEAGALLLAD